jgi:phage terminase small subunit
VQLHRILLGQIARKGTTVEGADGQTVVSPLVTALNREAQLIMRAGSLLGLSPAARVGLEVPELGLDKFDGLIGPFGPQGPPAA